MIWATPTILVGTLIVFSLAYAVLSRRYPKNPATLVDTIDALLPQTQCAQCHYPGCRPYAQAISEGAALNLCPPGGETVHRALIELMGESNAGAAPSPLAAMLAVIDESQCIGCALCLPPCPVDAIVGAANHMHTVINAQCTGCELCVPACPVDCISMVQLEEQAVPHRRKRTTTVSTVSPLSCINCSRCNPVCPVGLPAQELLHSINLNQQDLAIEQGLNQCIECGLCDRACPSGIAMAGLFQQAKTEVNKKGRDTADKQRYKARYDAHLSRQQTSKQAAADKRRARLRDTERWS